MLAFLLYIRKKMKPVSVIVNGIKQTGAALILIIMLANCQTGSSDKNSATKVNEVNSDSFSIMLPLIQNDPVALKTLDSIPLPALKDTSGKDDTGKDSIKFTRLFQLAANRLCRAEKDKDYNELSSFTPESIIRFYKSKATYIQRMKMSDEGRPEYEKILAGPIQRIAPAIDDKGFAQEWYCLIPVRSYRKDARGGKVVDMSWLGGQCNIKNQEVYFLNVTGLSREKILQVMPDLTFVLDKQ